MTMHEIKKHGNNIACLYMDCMFLLENASAICEITSMLKRINDSRARRSTSGEPTSWEHRTALKIAAQKIKGKIEESEWKSKFSRGNIVLTNKKTLQEIEVPISKLDEAENEENYDKFKGRSFRGGSIRQNTIISPITGLPQRTLAQSLYDLSNLIAVLGTLSAALGAVKAGVFGTAISKAVSKLKYSKKGLEEAQKELIKTVK